MLPDRVTASPVVLVVDIMTVAVEEVDMVVEEEEVVDTVEEEEVSHMTVHIICVRSLTRGLILLHVLFFLIIHSSIRIRPRWWRRRWTLVNS